MNIDRAQFRLLQNEENPTLIGFPHSCESGILERRSKEVKRICVIALCCKKKSSGLFNFLACQRKLYCYCM